MSEFVACSGFHTGGKEMQDPFKISTSIIIDIHKNKVTTVAAKRVQNCQNIGRQMVSPYF